MKRLRVAIGQRHGACFLLPFPSILHSTNVAKEENAMYKRFVCLTVLVGFVLFSVGVGICGDLRTLEPPNKMGELSIRTPALENQPKIDESIYQDFSKKIEGVPRAEKERLKSVFVGKMSGAKSFGEFAYYQRLIRILEEKR
jgi:hypothetical protein